MVNETTSSRGFIQAKVLKYMTDRPGQVVYLQDLCSALDARAGSVQSVMQRAMQNGYLNGGLETEVRGQAWKYTPNKEHKPLATKPEAKAPEPTKTRGELFEKIGEAKDGSLILESEAGKLYRASEL